MAGVILFFMAAFLLTQSILFIQWIFNSFAETFSFPEPSVKPIFVNEVSVSDLNTNSSIKEFKLPDGSVIAVDSDKVDMSIKSAI